MKAPQWIYIGLLAFGLVEATIKHGQPKGEYNAYHTLVATALVALLLWWGGFWG